LFNGTKYSQNPFDRTLIHSVNPVDLNKLKLKYGLGQELKDQYREYLGNIKCKNGRFFIPVLWSGKGSNCYD